MRTNMELLTDWKSIGSLLATFMFIRTAIREFLPPEIRTALRHLFSMIFSYLQNTSSIIIEEFDNTYTNEIFDDVQSYLGTKCISSTQVLKLSRSKNSKNLTFAMGANQTFEETYEGFKVKWSLRTVQKNSTTKSRSDETHHFELSFDSKYKEMIHLSYIPHVLEVAKMIKFQNRERKLYTNRSSDERSRLWSSVPFSHPSTFETIAIDPILKQEIKEDLVKFVNGRDFYNRVGRAWKRGYLLYGPPGTGKTSLIAAIGNFLKFDIYDLELTSVVSNSQLRKLLISTSSKSVIVVEDIDCSLDFSDRAKESNTEKDSNEKGVNTSMTPKSHSFGSTVSLSGVLNFIDGLWSCCGEERLMIFTTNHKEKLDPALLRPGRMDKHINLSYCEIQAFKMLMKNYLGIDKHGLVKEVEEVLPLVNVTPADIAEVFMSCEENADMGMKNVVEVMKKRLRTFEPKEEKMEKENGRTLKRFSTNSYRGNL